MRPPSVIKYLEAKNLLKTKQFLRNEMLKEKKDKKALRSAFIKARIKRRAARIFICKLDDILYERFRVGTPRPGTMEHQISRDPKLRNYLERG